MTCRQTLFFSLSLLTLFAALSILPRAPTPCHALAWVLLICDFLSTSRRWCYGTPSSNVHVSSTCHESRPCGYQAFLAQFHTGQDTHLPSEVCVSSRLIWHPLSPPLSLCLSLLDDGPAHLLCRTSSPSTETIENTSMPSPEKRLG